MIPNCRGCEAEYEYAMEVLENNPELHFAGRGFNEKGHFFMIIVNDEGKEIIS